MFVNRNERRIIYSKKTKPKVEKPPVVIPDNLLKRKYTVEQWRLYITCRVQTPWDLLDMDESQFQQALR